MTTYTEQTGVRRAAEREDPHFCERCGEKLNPATMKWLELNQNTGRYSDPDVAPLPESDSQGCFTFGAACAKAVLAAGGVNKKIRYRKGR